MKIICDAFFIANAPAVPVYIGWHKVENSHLSRNNITVCNGNFDIPIEIKISTIEIVAIQFKNNNITIAI